MMPELNAEIANHLESLNLPVVRKELIQDFLLGALDADPALSVRLGDDRWGALELMYSSRPLARIFPKGGKIQIYNHQQNPEAVSYGPHAEFNQLGQWVFPAKREIDMDLMLKCLTDNVESFGKYSHQRPTQRTGSGRGRQSNRQGISRRMRFAVLFRDSSTCQYCGRRPPEVILHVDHRIPVSKGGTNELENLLAACEDCNLGKSDRFVT